MIDVTKDIHSLTAFKRNSSGLMKHMKKTGRPLVLTVKGKAEAVLLDAKAYQEVASQLDAVASIRRGLAQARRGAGRPANEVFDELEREDDGQMTYRVIVTPAAESDLRTAYRYIRSQAPRAARDWIRRAPDRKESCTPPRTVPHGSRERILRSAHPRAVLRFWQSRHLSFSLCCV